MTPPAPWVPLDEALDPERHGRKAATLARLRAAGVPVLPGWVLPVDSPADASADPLTALLETDAWILRSSSPLEDRAGASAAGLFASERAAATPTDLADALRRVRASADDPRVSDHLDVDTVPLAVLAQPYRPFDAWCTIEWRAGHFDLEGWRFGDRPRRWISTGSESDEAWFDPVARAAATLDHDDLLFEVGVDGDDVWVLQARPAPPGSLRPRDDAAVPTALTGLGPDVHPGDEDVDWQWDEEHCPLPLCPLLATIFGRGIATSGDGAPSRLIDGRWHDRPPSRRPPLADAEVTAGIERWRRTVESVRGALRDLRRRVVALDGTVATWRAFVDAWLDVQTVYFSASSSRLRAWVRDLEDGRGIVVRGVDTIARTRARRWADLGRRAVERDDVPTGNVARFDAWIDAHADDPLARAIRDEHASCAHLCALPYDGRAVPWEEARDDLVRAILAHATTTVNEPSAADAHDDAVTAARAIVALAEDDDDVLLATYLQWRHAVRTIARATGVEPDTVLDLTVDDLEAWLDHRDPARRDTSLRAGRALAAHWNARAHTGDDASGPLSGRPASPGRVEGPVARAVHLGAIDAGGGTVVAVVQSVLPADAVHVPLLAGLVCETGDVLGHASILAREAGIPCVVDVKGARRKLAGVARVVVDGSGGFVVPIDDA